MCRLPLAEKESACFRSTSMHQWELLLLSWGSAAMLSTTVKDFSQHRGKNKPKISGLSSYFCWSIVPWVCVELVHELLQHRNFGIGDIYLQLFRWMKKCGRNITICWLCLSHFLNQICHLKKSGAICCSTQHRINVFKLCAALHPEGAVQVRILSPFAVNTPVAGEDVWCFTSAVKNIHVWDGFVWEMGLSLCVWSRKYHRRMPSMKTSWHDTWGQANL